MKLDLDTLNPIIDYRLDPGEPGLWNASPASLSVLRVASHELGNLVMFKSKALKEGGFIIYSRISLSLRKKGMYLAAVAGKTEVVIYKPNGEKKVIRGKPEEMPSILMRESGEIEGESREEKIRKLERVKRELLLRLSREDDEHERERLMSRIRQVEYMIDVLRMNPDVQDLVIEGAVLNSYA